MELKLQFIVPTTVPSHNLEAKSLFSQATVIVFYIVEP